MLKEVCIKHKLKIIKIIYLSSWLIIIIYILIESLRTIINEMGPFTDINAVRSILAQILSTISFIHSQNVLHRDLSDNNILIQPNGTVKIIVSYYKYYNNKINNSLR